MRCGHDNLPAVLTGIAGTRNEQLARAHCKEGFQRKRRLAPFRINTGCRKLSCLWPLHGNHGEVGAFIDAHVVIRGVHPDPGEVLLACPGINDEPVP